MDDHIRTDDGARHDEASLDDPRHGEGPDDVVTVDERGDGASPDQEPEHAEPDPDEPAAAEPAADEPAAAEPVAADDVAPAPDVETPAEPPAPRRSRSRRATRPTSTPAPATAAPLDVLAELGAPRTDEATSATGDRRVTDVLDRIVFESPSAGAGLTVEDEPDADESAPTPTDAEPDPEADLGVRLPVTTLLFQAPEPSRQRRRRAQAPAGPPTFETSGGAERGAAGSAGESAAETDGDETERAPAEASETGTDAPGTDAPGTDASETEAPEAEASEDASTAPRRRRRRGGRGRRRPNQGEAAEGAEDEGDGEEEPEETNGDEQTDESADEADESGEEAAGSGSRRRRRRRSRGAARPADADDAGSVRASRADEVTALKGSTRLEAKRQRRREGRDAGRRRTVVTEAEFLARRESVERAMVVRERDGRTQIAVVEDGVLVEHFVARRTQTTMVGNVYLGRVQNVLPSMEAAFVDLGKGRNAVLYAGEVNWDATGMEGQPRRIEQALSAGDSVMVQVTKDPIGHKGARLTSQITLAGRYLVLVPGGGMTGISRKLPDTERARLKRVLREIVTDGAGVIVRTAAEGASEEELRLDVARLQAQWAEIQKRSTTASAPALLSSEPDLAIRVVRDVFNEDFGSVTISGDDAWATISGYISSVAPDLTPRLHRWTEKRDVFAAHRIDEQLAKALDRKVWLPSGGSLVIDRTEAMTVIDVNTGKFTGTGGTLEETVTRNNLEAAEEIVRQLRLRDIGGIIVVDFIDMVLESNRDLVLRRLVECLGRDRTRHQVAEVTSLGLIQMTRKRVGQGLLEAFSETCDCCSGRGYVIHSEPVEKAGSAPAEVAPEETAKQGSNASRRRGRRGGESGRTAPARSAGAAATPDADAVAAREAMKAALASIAAASAHAHESPDEGGGMDEQVAPNADDVPTVAEAGDVEVVGEPSQDSREPGAGAEPAAVEAPVAESPEAESTEAESPDAESIATGTDTGSTEGESTDTGSPEAESIATGTDTGSTEGESADTGSTEGDAPEAQEPDGDAPEAQEPDGDAPDGDAPAPSGEQG